MPDKLHLGFGYACDGPGRGGTCDLSAWDTSYLAIFWLLNTCAWITFYFHWKHLSFNIVFQFNESSTSLNGWFRDYLWFNSTALIHGYNSFGSNTGLSIWAWAFLGAHLYWSWNLRAVSSPGICLRIRVNILSMCCFTQE